MAGKLIIFSAPSGSGKSTIINYLLKQNLKPAFLYLGDKPCSSRNRKGRREYYFHLTNSGHARR